MTWTIFAVLVPVWAVLIFLFVAFIDSVVDDED